MKADNFFDRGYRKQRMSLYPAQTTGCRCKLRDSPRR
jgi:hypothetical protein